MTVSRILAPKQRRVAGKALAAVLDIAIAYGVWQLLSVAGVLPEAYFPSANEVLVRLGELVIAPAFWNVVGITMKAWAIGLALGAGIGILLGIVLGASPRAYDFCRVVIEVVRPIPPVVLIPIALLVLGLTLQMKLVLIVQATVWVVLIQAIYGVRSVDPVTLQTARSFGLNRWRQFVFVRVPGSLPFIATGLRVAAAFALISTIVAELVGGAPGLGNDILRAVSTGDQVTMYALILVTGVLGVLVNIALRLVERGLLFWHASQREG